jgi:hypothetical protein
LLRRRPRRQQGNGDERRHGAGRSHRREPDKCLNSGGREEVLPASLKSSLRLVLRVALRPARLLW